MKLKAIILATGLINCIVFSAQAVDTTITVTGNVLQRTCNVPGMWMFLWVICMYQTFPMQEVDLHGLILICLSPDARI